MNEMALYYYSYYPNNEFSIELDEVSNNNPVTVDQCGGTRNSLCCYQERLTTANAISTSGGLGLCSLPPELRVEIFRNLLVEPFPLTLTRCPIPDILNTSHLIRREALQVFYGENTFSIDLRLRQSWPNFNRHIRDTIQNINFEPRLSEEGGWTLPHRSQREMIGLICHFGSPAIVRRNLNITFRVGACTTYQHGLFSWFLVALRRFTNFRNIQVEFRNGSLCSELCETLKRSLSPFFGPAESSADECGLRFHPHRCSSASSPEFVDWMDFLDGIRLDWNRDGTNPDGLKKSAQNWDSEVL